jgi:hypothetical protein
MTFVTPAVDVGSAPLTPGSAEKAENEGGRGADTTKLRNGLLPAIVATFKTFTREAVVILEEMIHDARFAPPRRTIPSPSICSTAPWCSTG